MDIISEEIALRRSLWAQVVSEYGGQVPPSALRDLYIYRGQRGIYTHMQRTRALTDGQSSITVGLMHTGTSYPDDLSADGVLYHYPRTESSSTDRMEIEATKAASVLGIPVFTITPGDASYRAVHLSWVEGWDDEAELFLVTFGEETPATIVPTQPEEPFNLHESINASYRPVKTRPGQQRFKFLVFQRYGAQCAVCEMNVHALLQAAHLVPVSESGSFDPRNGLVLCYQHHRALDVRLYAFNPDTTDVATRVRGPHPAELGITRKSLSHLTKQPHQDALDWVWQRWQRH